MLYVGAKKKNIYFTQLQLYKHTVITGPRFGPHYLRSKNTLELVQHFQHVMVVNTTEILY